MRVLKLITFISFILLLLGVSCEDKYSSGPAIAWTGGMITYTYSRGVISGFNIIVRFEVTDDQSGDIKITASHSGDEISSIASVVPGVEYKVIVNCSLSSSGETGSILIDSPSAEDAYTVTNRDNKISMGSITIE